MIKLVRTPEEASQLTTLAPSPEQAKVRSRPLLNLDVPVNMARGAASESYWQLAHTSIALREVLLQPGALYKALMSRGVKVCDVIAKDAPDAQVDLASSLRRLVWLEEKLRKNKN